MMIATYKAQLKRNNLHFRSFEDFFLIIVLSYLAYQPPMLHMNCLCVFDCLRSNWIFD